MLGLGGLVFFKLMHSNVKALYIRDKIQKSTIEIDEWIRQWKAVKPSADEHHEDDCQDESLYIDDQSRRLIEYAAQRAPSVRLIPSIFDSRSIQLISPISFLFVTK
jgi:hypothetical protein